MSYHARPLRVPAGTPAISTDLPVPSTTPDTRPTPPVPTSPPAPTSAPEPAAPVVPSAVTPRAAPWYRAEAWLVVSLLGFLPLLLALVVPQSLRVPLVGVAGLLIACGMVMLARRGAP